MASSLIPVPNIPYFIILNDLVTTQLLICLYCYLLQYYAYYINLSKFDFSLMVVSLSFPLNELALFSLAI